MDVTITPAPLQGEVRAIASKSAAHRLLIASALADAPTRVACNTTSDDIDATVACLSALGAKVVRTGDGFDVTPMGALQGAIAATPARTPAAPPTASESAPAAPSAAPSSRRGALLDCGESGSTLRFMLPVACALGASPSDPISLTGHGRLAQRPLSPLYEQLAQKGCSLSPQGTFPLHVGGTCDGGRFELAGDVSSQFVTGLLLAAPIMRDGAQINVGKPVQSLPYIHITLGALAAFGVNAQVDDLADRMTFAVDASQRYVSPATVDVEGDWSNAAFWLIAGALGGCGIRVTGLDAKSRQGDRAIVNILERFGASVERGSGFVEVRPASLKSQVVDVSDIPDLAVPLCALASVAEGTTVLENAGRLRLKESDRIATTTAALTAIGADIQADGDRIVVNGRASLNGGAVDAANDHRIAMMAAIAAIRSTSPVAIKGAQCVRKSYTGFFEDYRALGGQVSVE